MSKTLYERLEVARVISHGRQELELLLPTKAWKERLRGYKDVQDVAIADPGCVYLVRVNGFWYRTLVIHQVNGVKTHVVIDCSHSVQAKTSYGAKLLFDAHDLEDHIDRAKRLLEHFQGLQDGIYTRFHAAAESVVP